MKKMILACLFALLCWSAANLAHARLNEGQFILSVEKGRITLQSENASLKKILIALEEETGLKVVIYQGVPDRKVTVSTDTTPIYAIDSLLKQLSLRNTAIVYEERLRSMALYVFPEGMNPSTVLQGKTIIRPSTFPDPSKANKIKGKPFVTTLQGKNKVPIRYVDGEVLLKFHRGVTKEEIDAILSKNRLEKDGANDLSRLGYVKVRIGGGRDVLDVVKEMRKEHKLKIPEPNYILTPLTVTDPLFSQQWYVPETHFDAAWEILKSRDTVSVAVIDTGVNGNHPDLKGRVLKGCDFVNGKDDAGDDHGHGTFVAGIIAASANNIGIRGLYDEARILPVKAIDNQGLGTYEAVAQGIIYAADAGARVINLSVGGYAYSYLLQDAVDYALEKGCILVAAGGNDGIEQQIYPAAYPDVIGVSALSYSGQIWSNSNSGKHIDVAAPGAGIFSTGLGEDYVNATGTSASASMVSALAAMLVSERPDLSSSVIERLIMQSAKDLGEKGRDIIYGFGEIDAKATLAQGVKPFHDVAVRSVHVEQMVFEKGKPTYIVANIENAGTYKSEKFDVVLYEIAGEDRKEIAKQEGVDIIDKIKIIFEWKPEGTKDNVKFEVLLISENDSNNLNNSKISYAFRLKESNGLYVLHANTPPVHGWIAYQAYKKIQSTNSSLYNEMTSYIGPSGDNSSYLSGTWTPSSTTHTSNWPNSYSAPYCPTSPCTTAVIEGVWEEDEPWWETRWMDHFWDPTGGYDNGLLPVYGSALKKAQETTFLNAINNYLSNPQDKNAAYYWLGRTAHLLTDMSVSAHALNDPHPAPLGDRDSFENYVAYNEFYKRYNSTHASQFSQTYNSYTPSAYDSTLTSLFYGLANKANNYDTDDYPGEISRGIYNVFDYRFVLSSPLYTYAGAVSSIVWYKQCNNGNTNSCQSSQTLTLGTHYEYDIGLHIGELPAIYVYDNVGSNFDENDMGLLEGPYDVLKVTYKNSSGTITIEYLDNYNYSLYYYDLVPSSLFVEEAAGNHSQQKTLESYAIGNVAALYQLFWDKTHATLTVTKTGNGSVTSNPSGISCGSDCSESFASGTSVSLTATADSGWSFVNWGGSCNGTGGCTVSMTSAKNVSATFTQNPLNYTLTVTKTGNGSVTSSPTGISCGSDCSENYTSGATVTLTATPDSGWSFGGWGGSCSGTGGCTVSMTSAKSATATFAQNPINNYALTVTKVGNGTVNSNPIGISCGSDCSENYISGMSVTLTATPDSGWSFSGWGGSCNGTGSCTVSMTSTKSVSTTFVSNSANVSPTVITSGPTSVLSGSARLNGSVNPNGLLTSVWFECAEGTGMVNPRTTTPQSVGSGTSTISLNDIISGLSPSVTYYYRIVASNSAGTSRGSIVAFQTTPIGAPIVETTPATIINSLLVQLNGTINSNGGNALYYFEWGTSAGYGSRSSEYGPGYWTDAHPVGYTLGGIIPGTTYHYRLVARNNSGISYGNDITFQAISISSLTVTKTGNGTVTSNPAGISCGSDCSENYTGGTAVTLTATPDAGWSFSGWGGACSGTGSCTVSMTSAISVSATFTSISPLSPSLSSPVSVATDGGQQPRIKKRGNNIYVLNGGNNQRLMFYKSTDNGTTFVSATLASPVLNSYEYEFIMDTNGYLYAIWVSYNDFQIYIRRSLDGGITWSSEAIVSGGFTWMDDLSGYFSNGTLYLLFRGVKNSTVELYLTRSTDYGSTFSTPVQVTNNTIQEDNGGIAVFGNNVYVVYYDAFSASPYNIYLIASSDGGSSFGSPIRVNRTIGKSDFGSSLGVDGAGNIFVAYSDTTSDGEGDLYIAKSMNGGSSFNYVLASDSTYKQQGYPRIFIDANNYVNLLWNDNRDNTSYGSVYYTRSIDGGASYQANISIRSTGGISNGSLYVDSGVVNIAITDYKTSPVSTIFYRLTWLTDTAPLITSMGTASGTVGQAFSYKIMASNSPTSYGASGLPAGVTVNTSTGLISGTPTASGTFNVTVIAANAGGTGSKTVTITIAPSGAPVITSAGTASGTVNQFFSYPITATNSPTSYGASGLPAGLSVNTSTGLISGTPTASGTFNVIVTATNTGGTGSKTVTITIAHATERAGTVKLPQTGQTTCYDASGAVIACAGTGQDGELQMGTAWPNPRFTDKGDQTVMDNLTGLIWTKDANVMKTQDPGFDTDSIAGDGMVTWQHALDYIKKLNQESYLGHNDWHLPNIIELESLFNAGQSHLFGWLSLQGFSNIQAYYYWSSTTFAASTTYSGLLVNMYDGLVSNGNKSVGYYLWPVRSGQSGSLGSSIISLPKTGQITCYDASGSSIACVSTGQDGELQMGAAWPGTRFVDNGDQTVFDNLTGLIWTKDGDIPGPINCGAGQAKTWQGALDYVKCLNTNNFLGRNDWRLPNRKELWSLVNNGQTNSSNWLNSNGFSNVQVNDYWSSSTYANDDYSTYYAWVVRMSGSGLYGDNKSAYISAWPVRSGQSGSPTACTYSLSPVSDGFASTSALGVVTVTPSSSNCSWSAASNDSWISIISGHSGTGPGTVAYKISDNTSGSHRIGTIIIGEQIVIIRQTRSILLDDPNNVFSPYIYVIYTEGITVGCGGGNYCPSLAVSRGQMSAFIIRSLYGEIFSYTTTPYFSDVPTDHTFFKYAQKMKDNGITAVTGTYDVDGIVTRGQMAAFIIRAKYGESFSYTATPYFSDVPAEHAFFKYVQKMKDSGYTAVTGAYDVNGTVARDQMAAFLGRAFLGME